MGDPMVVRLVAGSAFVVSIVAFAVAMEQRKFRKHREKDAKEAESRRAGSWFGEVR